MARILPHREASAPVEVWGGVEYTCNRVGDRYLDQMRFSGHAQRTSDYEHFAELGLRTLRIGLLWERHVRSPGWHWEDEHLACVRGLGMRPIAGLLHHGSGPPDTNLLDPEFPAKLAQYAGQVAERYPWIEAYTPINEPNTTARFSGLYGVWYPHHHSCRSYFRALLQQMKATVLSMEAIRRVRPDAQLIQTEDVGRTVARECLISHCDRLNLRRWLPFDLLCGRVDRYHPMYAWMRDEGIDESEILWFTEHPCPPSVIGVNYYLTSDRYLDERLDLFPQDRRSAEGEFADVEAVRVCQGGISGVDSLLLGAWERYGIPVAMTEVHLGGGVEEQIRWMAESWEAVHRARRRGAQCIALTAWALLGSYFWNRLVTSENGYYEPGVFDMRSGRPVPTELAAVVAQIANGRRPSHAALSRRGWWHQPNRILFAQEREMAA